MSDIKITIGARLDRSVQDSFAQIKRMGKEAAESVNRDLSGRSRRASVQNPELEAARAVYAEQSRLNRAILAEQRRAARESDREARRLARERAKERMAAIREEARERRRSEQAAAALNRQRSSALYREFQAQERASTARERELDRFATRTSHRATRFFFPPPEGAIGYAKRTASELIRGVGVDFSFAGGVSRNREREAAAAGIANQERLATGKTIGTAAWGEVSRKSGEELSMAPEKVTELMRAFTGKTGEFAKVRDMVGDLGRLAVASGADLGQVGDAAGYVYNQLKGFDNAGQTTIDVMRSIVAQTSVGAVEMQDYATQMGRIAANAQKFKGPASENIKKLSALTQLAVESGGATSAADAARSINALVNTFGKEARISAFAKEGEGEGVQLFTDESKSTGPRGKIKLSGTKLRDPIEIIKDAIFKTKGDIPRLATLFADTLGRKPVTALANAWSAAGGGGKGSAGEKAIDDALAKYMSVTLDKDTEAKNLEEYKKTTEAKAQDFQNKLDVITSAMVNKLLPAFEKLEPQALRIANAFGNFVSWATENPGTLIAGAIVGSIARAGLESAARMMLERAIVAAFGGAPAGGALGALGTGAGSVIGGGLRGIGGRAVAGLAGASGMEATLGMAGAAAWTAGVLIGVGTAAYAATTALLELADAEKQKSALSSAQATNEQYMEGVGKIGAAQNPVAEQAAYEETRRKIISGEEARTGSSFAASGGPEARKALAELDKVHEQWIAKRTRSPENTAAAVGAEGQLSESDLAKALAGALRGQTINVKVSNTKDFLFSSDGPAVDGSGRSGREGNR